MRFQRIFLQCSAILFLFSVPCSGLLQGKDQAMEKAVLSKKKPVVIYGDTRNGHEVHKKIISLIMSLRPEAVFHTGDLVFNGKCNKNWSIFNSIVGDLLKIAPIYPALGNHERGAIKISQDLKLPNNGKWYSVDVQNIHFIILDVEENYRAGCEQYRWLQKDLENQPGSTKYTVAITHYPFYTTGPHKSHIKRLRSELIPLFKRSGVDVVFSGHNHCYERSYADGIYYIVTAGGGAPLYNQVKKDAFSQLYIRDYNFCELEQSNDTLFISALDTTMRRIDRFYIPAGK
jgi:acid phosphatase type 7